MDGIDERALQIVNDYVAKLLDKRGEDPNFFTHIVWKCKVLQNAKFIVGTTLLDGMLYELTFDGDNRCWYLDAYKKAENVVIKE